MTVKNQKDVMYAGNYRVLRFSPITDEAGDPLDMTGFTIKWTLSKYGSNGKPNKTPLLERKSTTAGQMTLTNVATGSVDVILAEGLTAALEGTYYQQLEIFDGSNRSNVVAVGDIEILRNIDNT